MSKAIVVCAAMIVLALCAAGAYAGEATDTGAAETTPTGEGTATTETPAESSEPTYRGDESAAIPLYRRAERAYEERNYEEAVRLLQQAYAAHEHPYLVYNMGQAQRNARNYEEAITAYRQYLQLVPREELINETYISIGECLLGLGRREEANEAFQHYLNLERQGDYAGHARRAVESGESPAEQDRRDPAQVHEARQLCDRADTLWAQEQYEEAALLFLQGYEHMPEMHELLYNAALAYLDGERWGDAARTFSRYVRTPGADHDAWAFLGESYAEECGVIDAIRAYERYLELEPQGTYADQAREYVNEFMPGEWSDPSVDFQPTHGEVERARTEFVTAREHYDASRYREALEGLQRAYRIIPGRALVFNMGRCHFRLNEWQESLTHYERALQRGDEGEYAYAHIEAAECLLELNRPAEAARHLQAYRDRAATDDLPEEETNMERVRDLQQRVGDRAGTGGSEHTSGTD